MRYLLNNLLLMECSAIHTESRCYTGDLLFRIRFNDWILIIITKFLTGLMNLHRETGKKIIVKAWVNGYS